MEPFYLTVSSDGDGHFQKHNETGQFRAHLRAPITLEGRWEMGLAEMHMPCTIYTTKKTTLVKQKAAASEKIKMQKTELTDAENPAVELLELHCEVLQEQLQDDAHHKVLRTVNIKQDSYKMGAMKTFTFGRIFYYPLARTHITDLDFYITTELGKKATFLSGSLTLLLHFRPARDAAQ
jgi:hypothetical protein